MYIIQVLPQGLEGWTSQQHNGCWGHLNQVGPSAWGLSPSCRCPVVGEFRAFRRLHLHRALPADHLVCIFEGAELLPKDTQG